MENSRFIGLETEYGIMSQDKGPERIIPALLRAYKKKTEPGGEIRLNTFDFFSGWVDVSRLCDGYGNIEGKTNPTKPENLWHIHTTMGKTLEKEFSKKLKFPIRLYRTSAAYGQDIGLAGTHYNFDSVFSDNGIYEQSDEEIKSARKVIKHFGYKFELFLVTLSYITGSGYYDQYHGVSGRVVCSDRLFALKYLKSKQNISYDVLRFSLDTDLRFGEKANRRVHVVKLDSHNLRWSQFVAVGLTDLILFNPTWLDSMPDLHLDNDLSLANLSMDSIIYDNTKKPLTILDYLLHVVDWLERLIHQSPDSSLPFHRKAFYEFKWAVEVLMSDHPDQLLGNVEWYTLAWLIRMVADTNQTLTPIELASFALEFKAVTSPIRDEIILMFPDRLEKRK